MNEWPWPADSPLDISRRVAWSYREALLTSDPDGCQALDETMVKRGQRWVIPKVDQFDSEDLLTVLEAADYCDVQVKTIYEWRRRGLKITKTVDGIRYKVADLREYKASRRRARVARRAH